MDIRSLSHFDSLPFITIVQECIARADALMSDLRMALAGILLTPFDPAFEAGMQAFEAVNAAYRSALRELSKK